jgi:hypothetical protein
MGNAFQRLVSNWISTCFPSAAHDDIQERNHRFLEEALELAQANGCSRQQAIDLVEYVFDRPTGDKVQETGGVMVTLAALCNATQLDMNEAGLQELDRNWIRMEAIRAKQASRPVGSALPQ